MKILILSPYDAVSHALWRSDLADFLNSELTAATVCQVAMPPRHFSWRFRGNSLSLAHHEALQEEYDLVIATSMTDLSALRGLNNQMRDVPVIVYFHENQFAYPQGRQQHSLLEAQMVSPITKHICC